MGELSLTYLNFKSHKFFKMKKVFTVKQIVQAENRGAVNLIEKTDDPKKAQQIALAFNDPKDASVFVHGADYTITIEAN